MMPTSLGDTEDMAPNVGVELFADPRSPFFILTDILGANDLEVELHKLSLQSNYAGVEHHISGIPKIWNSQYRP